MFSFFSSNHRTKLGFALRDFAHANKDLLIIVCDPKSDNMMVAYKDKIVTGVIKSVQGKKQHVVKNVLYQGGFEKHIDGFLGSLVEILKVNLKAGGHFFKFIDGALFNLSKALHKDKKPMAGAVLSPIQQADIKSTK